MKSGIIGLPQVGKTSLFTILTGQRATEHSYGREAHVGIATVPDERFDKLTAMYNSRKLVRATVEYADVAAMSREELKESALLTTLRQVDSPTHVLRAFEDPAIPHVGEIDPLRDARNLEFDLMISDLGQIEKRLERLEKDLKRMKSAELEREHEVLIRAKGQLEAEHPLRELEMSADDQKRLRGFGFLSQKPVLYVLNIGESSDLGNELQTAAGKYGIKELASRPNAGATAVCGKVEAELAEMGQEEATEFLASYGLKESGLVRLIRKTSDLLGIIVFFTVAEPECHAWQIPKGTRAVDAAGAIHSDLAKGFIRAETISWKELLDAGSEANARARGTLRLEGKDYIVQDGDILHIRHSN